MTKNEEKVIEENEKKSKVEELLEKIVSRYMEEVESDSKRKEPDREIEKEIAYKCPECGARVPELAKYCPACGVELEWEE